MEEVIISGPQSKPTELNESTRLSQNLFSSSGIRANEVWEKSKTKINESRPGTASGTKYLVKSSQCNFVQPSKGDRRHQPARLETPRDENFVTPQAELSRAPAEIMHVEIVIGAVQNLITCFHNLCVREQPSQSQSFLEN